MITLDKLYSLLSASSDKSATPTSCDIETTPTLGGAQYLVKSRTCGKCTRVLILWRARPHHRKRFKWRRNTYKQKTWHVLFAWVNKILSVIDNHWIFFPAHGVFGYSHLYSLGKIKADVIFTHYARKIAKRQTSFFTKNLCMQCRSNDGLHQGSVLWAISC